ncbi:hypothetical protein SeMB42_g03431 [Synchytrium endobioticum]|uniref:Uncharacterized protein n=1 Tax=Synchytrium endobioticum TaxID=286115 RepID=A0A507D6V6_9FUNG|nr:hypothetical protein SeMB42_g03431 [Synchytrium endobioticum]
MFACLVQAPRYHNRHDCSSILSLHYRHYSRLLPSEIAQRKSGGLISLIPSPTGRRIKTFSRYILYITISGKRNVSHSFGNPHGDIGTSV